MGILTTIELANDVESGTKSLNDALSEHLRNNFVRPICLEWLPICVGIVEQYKGGDHDISYEIHAPNKPKDVLLSAESIIEDLHLEPFVGELE